MQTTPAIVSYRYQIQHHADQTVTVKKERTSVLTGIQEIMEGQYCNLGNKAITLTSHESATAATVKDAYRKLCRLERWFNLSLDRRSLYYHTYNQRRDA